LNCHRFVEEMPARVAELEESGNYSNKTPIVY